MTDREAIEHAAAVADVYFDAWKRRQASAVTSRERRDFETMAIAATHIAAAIRELTTNAEQSGQGVGGVAQTGVAL